jgi:hypothetical protein
MVTVTITGVEMEIDSFNRCSIEVKADGIPYLIRRQT